mmetsp:Transcript_6171/g.9377  ORF Transcript_6171/g.9377 Transcript_6171/m.9377 type:complete len:88 (+) Transcript_6171:319-582(+)
MKGMMTALCQAPPLLTTPGDQLNHRGDAYRLLQSSSLGSGLVQGHHPKIFHTSFTLARKHKGEFMVRIGDSASNGVTGRCEFYLHTT